MSASAAGNWFVTPHAIRRYIERCKPGMSREKALRELVALSRVARFRRDLGPGIVEMVGPKPSKWRFRVSTRGPGRPQLLTVIGRGRGC